MPNSIEDYRKLIEKPWGRMFYDTLFKQLDLSDNSPLKILDFGAGFCVTADHYGKHHKVVAIEPDEEMIKLSIHENHFELIHGGKEALSAYADNSFDFVFCHNVLEYVPDKEVILKELARIVKPGGKLSIVKHNLMGRIMAYAVFADDPKAALDLLECGDNEKSMFGKRNTYSDDHIIGLGRKYGLFMENIFGIRTFFALSQNDDIKFTPEWYDNMLALEMRTCNITEYNSFSFFRHLIFQKNK
ncbi:MAG: methyltransferase domain-containing protein [Oscillospiraceae bacterium]|nr:methyltransferase domain-containing protein [Oscillospiraceae bacterium]